jgi:hypothetical protein
MSCQNKVLEISSASICDAEPVLGEQVIGEQFRERLEFCQRRNGTYAFESALHVFPLCTHSEHTGFHWWNAPQTWKHEYEGAVDHIEFFAEDIFGEQFGIASDAIVLFNPETGQVKQMSKTFDDWACDILADYEFLTGYPFAHEWQQQFGPLRAGMRLAPKTPFMFGGQFMLSNFYAADPVKLMRFRGDIYRQTRTLPDGKRVKVTIK